MYQPAPSTAAVRDTEDMPLRLTVLLSRFAVAVALKLAFAVWFIASLPLVITNALWMKLDRLVAVAHALGWLAKLIVFALVVAWLKP